MGPASSACISRAACSPTGTVRTLDVAPLDDASSSGGVEELRGDIRDRSARARARRRRRRARARGSGAADPGVARGDPLRQRRRARRTCSPAALDAGVRRVVLISSTAVYGVPGEAPDRRGRPARRRRLVRRVEDRRRAARREFGGAGSTSSIVRPKTFIGPERLGVFEILFDWIREGRRIPILGDGANRYQLLAVEDLVDAIVRASTAPAAAGRRSTSAPARVRHRPRRPAGADRPRRLGVAAPARPGQAGGDRAARARAAARSRRSPSGTTRPRTRTRSSTIVEGAATARLGAAALERAMRCRDLRLVPRATARCAAARASRTASRGTSRRSAC